MSVVALRTLRAPKPRRMTVTGAWGPSSRYMMSHAGDPSRLYEIEPKKTVNNCGRGGGSYPPLQPIRLRLLLT